MAESDRPLRAPWLRPELVASWREIAAVLVIFNGYFVGSAVGMGVDRLLGRPPGTFRTNAAILHTTAMEAVMLAAFFALLWQRGWKVADLRIHRDSAGTSLGLVFCFRKLFC